MIAQPVPDPTPTLEIARRAFLEFLSGVAKSTRLVVLHDSDADGVTAGIICQRACERAGYLSVDRVIPNRERDAWAPSNRALVAAARPERLFVLDLGCRGEDIIAGVPSCFIDHHRPEGIPPSGTLISSYRWLPAPNTSLLAWQLCATISDVADLDWIAAIGLLSDLGDKAPFELLAAVKKKHKLKDLKEATTLINAARRAANYNPEAAAAALLSHRDPHALVVSHDSNVERLRAARDQVKSELNRAKQAAPIFAGKVALIRIKSPCQIHSLMAQIWRTRLPRYIVIAANERFLPDRVNFSARSAQDISVIDLLRGIGLPPGAGNYGHGHDQASGGSLPIERWNELLARLGFPASAFAQ